MGKFAIKPIVKLASWVITLILLYLNLRMLEEQVATFFATSDSVFLKSLMAIGSLLLIGLLVYTVIYPMQKIKLRLKSSPLHQEPSILSIGSVPDYKTIAVALDFSDMDEPLFHQALAQGKSDSRYILIHVVESVSANVYYSDSVDNETKTDEIYLNNYVEQLDKMGIKAEAHLGFGKTYKEIARIVTETQAELLVIGAHGHRGLKDFIYGETINKVRHLIKIPLLVVNKPKRK